MELKNTLRILHKALNSKYVLYVLTGALFLGTYYARAVVSIVTVAFGVLAVIAILQKERRISLTESRATLALTAIFILYLVSGIYSANTDLWLRRLETNLPYLLIPIGIWSFGPLSRRVVTNVILLFIAVTALSAAALMADYLVHFEEYNAYYKVGKTIPTPIVHVRYSFFLALASALGIGTIADGAIETKIPRYLLVAATVLLVVAVHILAVRTGIFSLYGAVVALTLVMLFRGRKWKLGIAVLGSMAILLVAGITLLPSMKNKFGYMRYDLNKLRSEGVSPDYSDNIRLTSIQHGLKIFAKHPLIGVGVGDVQDEMNKMYEEFTPQVPVESRFFPISQYVYWLVAFGSLGSLILIALWLFPLVTPRMRNYAILGFYAVFLFSFFAETTVQLQYGKTIFLVLISTFLQYYGRRDVIVEAIGTAHN